MNVNAGRQVRLDAEGRTTGRLLIVDDNRDFASALRNVLVLEGYEVSLAHNEDAARTQLGRFDAEVVLLDLRLEAERGLDLMAPLLREAPGLVFIIMTGYAETDMAVEALRRGAYDFLLKPIGSRKLLAALERAFEKIRLEQAKSAAERALRKSEADLAKAQEIAGIGSWTWDIAADRWFWSAAQHRIFGLDPRAPAVTYDEYLSMVHEEDREAVIAAVAHTLETHEPHEMDYRFVRADGEIRFAHALGEVDLDDAGKAIRMSGTVQDVTDRMRIEEQLRQAQKMEAVGQLTGGIAHDFNNLLTVMLGNLEYVRDKVDGDTALRDMIDRGVRAAERGADLTDRLLTFSRKQTLRPAAIDLDKLVSGTMVLLRRTLEETIEITAEGGAGLWLCYADQSQLENALLNLSLNARDAMPKGGRLTIETANLSLDDEHAAAQADVALGDYVVLSVSDNGIGIADDALGHVFEPFFTTKEVGKGTGLGLSMVYGFAKQSGGHVTIYSEPNQGTTVKLYLPRAAAKVDETQLKQASCELPLARDERVLVVEDDADVRALAVELLSDLGYEIDEAGSAEAALKVLEHTATMDLLLSDVVLPGAMNGLDLAAEFQRRSPSTKIVYMTGYAENAFNNHNAHEERCRVLQKPFKKADLATTIRSALDDD